MTSLCSYMWIYTDTHAKNIIRTTHACAYSNLGCHAMSDNFDPIIPPTLRIKTHTVIRRRNQSASHLKKLLYKKAPLAFETDDSFTSGHSIPSFSKSASIARSNTSPYRISRSVWLSLCYEFH